MSIHVLNRRQGRTDHSEPSRGCLLYSNRVAANHSSDAPSCCQSGLKAQSVYPADAHLKRLLSLEPSILLRYLQDKYPRPKVASIQFEGSRHTTLLRLSEWYSNFMFLADIQRQAGHGSKALEWLRTTSSSRPKCGPIISHSDPGNI